MRTTTDLIRELTAAGHSQSDIARKTGIPQPRLSRWAAGDTPAGADDALKLLQLHAQLVGRGDAASPPPQASTTPQQQEAA